MSSLVDVLDADRLVICIEGARGTKKEARRTRNNTSARITPMHTNRRRRKVASFVLKAKRAARVAESSEVPQLFARGFKSRPST